MNTVIMAKCVPFHGNQCATTLLSRSQNSYWRINLPKSRASIFRLYFTVTVQRESSTLKRKGPRLWLVAFADESLLPCNKQPERILISSNMISWCGIVHLSFQVYQECWNSIYNFYAVTALEELADRLVLTHLISFSRTSFIPNWWPDYPRHLKYGW